MTETEDFMEDFNRSSYECAREIAEVLIGFNSLVAIRAMACVIIKLVECAVEENSEKLTKGDRYRTVLHCLHEFDNDIRDSVIDFLEETYQK